MTLDTSIAIGKPTDVRELFQFCRTLLGTPADTPVHEGAGRTGVKEIYNPGGIGLPAWLWIYYGADGPMIEKPDDPTDADEIEYIADTPTKNGWAAIEVTFDTAYGYTGPAGESCSTLHARYIRAVGAWCDRKGLPWKWQNEFTGEWHDRTEGLAEFGDAYASTGAEDWFSNVAMPAIAAHAGGAS